MCILFLSGCATGLDYRQIDRHMAAGDCPAALDSLEKSRYSANQKLLYFMDAAMINMRCGNNEAAVDYLHQAENLARDLWTLSVSREMASFLWNDYTRPYAGEDFERAMINLMAAVSYIRMGDHNAALVEFRRLDSLLNGLNDKYEKKNVYKEDAFARYMSGILYEDDGNINDAFIAYYRAYEIYNDYQKYYGTPIPSILLADLYRTGKAVDRIEDIRKLGVDPELISRYKDDEIPGYGKIVIVGFKGRAPRKVESALLVPTRSGPVKIAFPDFVVEKPVRSGRTVIVESEEDRFTVDTHLVQDVNMIAVKNLHDKRGRTMARVAARTLAKQVAIDLAAKEAGSDVLRLGMNIANLFVERADTRSWRTLPGEIYLSRLFVPAGDYTVHPPSGYGAKTRSETVIVTPGSTEFIFQMM